MGHVFIEDVEKFLIQSINLQGYAPVGGTQPWGLTSVPVVYHLPESGILPDFQYNLVSFFLYDMQLDTDRLQSDVNIRVGENELTKTVTTKKLPIPYKLFYQIDLWSLKQTSMVKMMTDFQRAFPPRMSLLVPDAEGEIHDLFMELSSYKSGDGKLWDTGTKQSEDRFFRRIFRYCIYVDLDSSAVTETKMVDTVHVNPYLIESMKVGD